MSWFKKMMNFMFDDEPSETEESINQEIHKQEKTESGNQRTVGRFQNGQNNSAPRMVSRYPSEGKFRFPLVSDEEELGTYRSARANKPSYSKAPAYKNVKETYQPALEQKKEIPIKEKQSSASKEEKARVFKPSEIPSPIYGFGSREGRIGKENSNTADNRYSNPSSKSQFRPTEIPSPIYGFGSRDKGSKDNKEESIPTAYEKRPKSNFKPSQVPSPIYGYGERRPDTILNPGLWKLSEIQKKKIPDNELMEELLKEPITIKEPVVLQRDEEVEPPVLHEEKEEQPLGLVRSKDEPILLLDEFKKDTIELTGPSEPVIQLESSPELKTERKAVEQRMEESLPALETETVYESLNSEPIVMESASAEPESETELESEPMEEYHEQPEEILSPAVEERQREVAEHQKEPVKKPGGSYVPFNVLMLKKDRKPADRQPEVKNSLVKKEQAVRHSPEPVSASSFPQLDLLHHPPVQEEDDSLWMEEQRDLLQLTLDNFNVNARVVNITKGPSVTRLEVQPAPGVKVNKITNLSDDIKLSLSAKDIRIEAPIPGKNTIGIEVPNRHSQAVYLREILQSEEFRESSSPLTVALGLDLSGSPIVTDLQKMPHGLIAGATGSGKSVCINSILVSLMYKASPEDVRLLLVDPKMVELAPYNAIPHLVTPVITDPKEATTALKWTVEEMERRYEAFARNGVRDIKRYNDKMKSEQLYANKMPYIVVVIDELADLMMVSPQDVEEAICRIAQKARACGIHLLLATQRPSVDVITGLIKANIPTRAAFAVSSAIDSRTIIDISGAERLLGRGDMLFMENGSSKAVRIQGNFVSDEEIERVTAFVKEQYPTHYLFSREELIQSNQTVEQEDDLFEEACYYVLDVGAASSSSIQRRFRVGYNRAARLVEMMEAFGLVSEAMGSKPRNVLMSQEEFQSKMFSEAEV
ncbi:DNA translocase FtsK [Fictibacillus sp. KU28468]|uniref:DNA translocase FtsK n=1 Tax=Fictibacillus sp. KU28468 TaxID=2991053 RepID=UPI00223E54F7|nr:DNA translocase FtsK [Fictibacillus sp. KU28468]UZJ80264.1 DNA translocase FtsK [Fictibacillus sp. KU28468]